MHHFMEINQILIYSISPVARLAQWLDVISANSLSVHINRISGHKLRFQKIESMNRTQTAD